MKTTLFAVLVAMMGAGNAVQLTDISATGGQLNIATTGARADGGDDNPDEEYADAYAEGGTTGQAISHGAVVMSDTDVESYSYVESSNFAAESAQGGSAFQLNGQEARRGTPASYDEDHELVPGEPEVAGVSQLGVSGAAGAVDVEGEYFGYAETEGDGMASVGW